MESFLLRLAQLGQDHESRLVAWAVLVLAAGWVPLLAWRLLRQRAGLRALCASLREGTRAGGALPRLPQARTPRVKELRSELVDWGLRHSHQLHWMRNWTQKREAEWRSLGEQLAPLLASAEEGENRGKPASPEGAASSRRGHAGEAGSGEMSDVLARAIREMDEALQGASALAREVRGLEESGGRRDANGLRAALEGITRSLSEGAQLLDHIQRHMGSASGGRLSVPQAAAAALRQMTALSETVIEEHRKMEGDLAKLIEGFLPDEPHPEAGEAPPAMDTLTAS